ncbi:winged helix-turn-helix domain-containing protein [Deinococcus hohokamensis]|uniref:Winged helix-turn-helix domain-containing protein n=1 Tax=Deinococcus hohokamensis TaxID=309883 RepID=A0ABV9IB01_9DEIO
MPLTPSCPLGSKPFRGLALKPVSPHTVRCRVDQPLEHPLVLGFQTGQAGQPLHVRELTRPMLDEGLWATAGKTPEATVSSRLSMSLKNQGEASLFIQTAPATFTLRPAAASVPTSDLDVDAVAPPPPLRRPAPEPSRTRPKCDLLRQRQPPALPGAH